MLLTLIAASHAATTVLVSAFQARNAEATGLASLVEGFVAQELDEHPDLEILRVEDTPAFDDYPARTYMEGCPPGEAVGCTFVVAQRAKARWAVTGSVQALVAGTRVTVDIVDVEGARTVLSFQSELDAGNDEAFAQGVARVLVAAIGGEFAEDDIRELAAPDDDDAQDAAVARQLEELSRELGAVSAVVTRGDQEIKRPTYTVEDLAARVAEEGASPWDKVGMSAGEYLRWKNSGKRLSEWRELAMGRAGQVVARPTVGYGRGAWSGSYYGRYAMDPGSLTPVDAWSAQVVQSDASLTGGVSLAYGLTPWVDVGAVFTVGGGSYTVDIQQQIVGETTGQRTPDEYQEASFYFGPRVTVSPMPTSRLRPVAGLEVLFGLGPAVSDKVLPPETLATWEAPLLVWMQPFVGGEYTVSDRADLWAVVPIGLLVSGDLTHTLREGTADEVEPTEPAAASTVGAGFQLGVQLRFGGKAPPETTRAEERYSEEE